MGKVSIRRISGNLETLCSQEWRDACPHAALQLVVHPGISGTKKATESCLAVDAMNFLPQQHISVSGLVTGGQDFTALALRLRHQGCRVYGTGQSHLISPHAGSLTEMLTQPYVLR